MYFVSSSFTNNLNSAIKMLSSLRVQLLEEIVDEKHESPSTENTKQFQYIGLYFCDSSCSLFTQQLKAFCSVINDIPSDTKGRWKNIPLQIIVISFDKEEEEERNETLKGSGWYALPLKNTLATFLVRTFNVRQTPALVLLDKLCNPINEFGVYSVLLNDLNGFPWKVPRFCELSAQRLCEVNFKPSLLLLADAPPHLNDSFDPICAISALERVASDTELRQFHYFYASFGNLMAHEIRARLGREINFDNAPPVSVAIIDFSRNFTYIQDFPKGCLSTISYFETGIRDLIFDYLSGGLTESSRSEIAPPRDEDLDHPGITRVVQRSIGRILTPTNDSEGRFRCLFLHVYSVSSPVSILFKEELEDLAQLLDSLYMLSANFKIGTMDGDQNTLSTKYIDTQTPPITRLFILRAKSYEWNSLLYNGKLDGRSVLEFIQEQSKGEVFPIDFEEAKREWINLKAS